MSETTKPPHGKSWLEYMKIILDPVLDEFISDQIHAELDAIDERVKEIERLKAELHETKVNLGRALSACRD